jgi:hypothetical protein
VTFAYRGETDDRDPLGFVGGFDFGLSGGGLVGASIHGEVYPHMVQDFAETIF